MLHGCVLLQGLVQILQSRPLRQGVGVVVSSISSFAKGKPGCKVRVFGANILEASLDIGEE